MTNRWQIIQQSIWNCSACQNIPRVSPNIRQQTDPPRTLTKLLVIGIAPPYQEGVCEKIRAKSATNDSNDDLRRFLETYLQLPYDTLTERGLAVLHAAKCAIQPKAQHQNPPHGVVENCSPRHFTLEFHELKPPVVLSLGERARRAVLLMPGCRKPRGLNLTGPLEGQYELGIGNQSFKLFVSPFFKQRRDQAGSILNAASNLAGLL
jgi:uracil-DNA glycosylase